MRQGVGEDVADMPVFERVAVDPTCLAARYVLKDVERGELLSVIRRVLTGAHAIESTLATELPQ